MELIKSSIYQACCDVASRLLTEVDVPVFDEVTCMLLYNPSNY